MALYGLDQSVWTLASGRITLAGAVRVMGLQGLTLKDEVDSAAVYGNGQRPIGRRRGQYKASGDLTILLPEFDQLAQHLGTPLDSTPFDISATYSEINGPGEYTVEASGMTITSNELAVSNDQKELVQKCNLLITAPILWNGVALITDDGTLIDAVLASLIQF
jgi:hypothetical protein